jgi:molecular chaperone IbpA
VFREFQFKTDNYPPHNIISISDNEFVLELAVAGFKKEEISVSENQGVLTIVADKGEQPESTYQHRGIGKRAFTKSLRIAEYFEVREAKLEDGILTILFVKNVPEEEQPKIIAIS